MKKRILAAVFLLIMISSMPFSALAAGGTGNGSGGGSSQPLTLVSSTVPDGSTGVMLDMTMTLTFSKNVVNMTVRDNNLTCFALADSKGSAVGINVLMGDDQVDPTIKNDVVIKPKARLSPDTSYTLTISGNLTSKSGVSMGQAMTLTFTTVSAPASSPASVTTPAASPASAPTAPSMSTPTLKPSPIPPASASPSTAPQGAPTPAEPASNAAASSPGAASAEASMPVSTGASSPQASASNASASNASASNASASNASASGAVQIIDNGGKDADSGENQPVSPVPYIAAAVAVVAIAGAVLIISRKKK